MTTADRRRAVAAAVFALVCLAPATPLAEAPKTVFVLPPEVRGKVPGGDGLAASLTDGITQWLGTIWPAEESRKMSCAGGGARLDAREGRGRTRMLETLVSR